MTTGSRNITDLYEIHNIVQNTNIWYPKELIIGVLRDEFSKDSYYHYVRDEWGFPKTPSHLGLPPEAGLNDDATTRVYIGEAYRYDVIYYPAVLVRNGGGSYVPISFNRNKETVTYSPTVVVDGYGNQTIFATPRAFVTAGAWEGTINIDVLTRGIRSRDDLVEIVELICTDIRQEELRRAGLFIQRISHSAPSEGDDRNDKLYKQTVTLNVRSEWRREIPITNLVEAINICIDFGNLQTQPAAIAPNLTISQTIQLVDAINSL